MFRSLPIWLLATTALAELRQFQLVLTWKSGAPDGYQRDMIYVNGQYPGPKIEVNQGDWVVIDVINRMPYNTTIHYHGIAQHNTPWSDGVPGLSQRPIQPGAIFRYKWHAGQYGSYFYHAHSRGQIDDGCYGPIVIKPTAENQNPFDKISASDVSLLQAAEANVYPVILSDWSHRTSIEAAQDTANSALEGFCKDSLLVNGKGAVNCWSRQDINMYTPAPLRPILGAFNLSLTDKGCVSPQTFQIITKNGGGINPNGVPPSVYNVCTPTQGSTEVINAPNGQKWLALDLISALGVGTIAFSIDEHPMWIYAVDGHYIEPMQVDAITISNGERYSVFIALDKSGGSYGVRLASTAVLQLIDTTAVLSYGNSNTTSIQSTPSINKAGQATSSSVVFFDQSQQKSFPPKYPTDAPEIDQTIILRLESIVNAYEWALNHTAFNNPLIDNINPPLLYQTPNVKSFDQNVTITTKNNTWVDLILQVESAGQPPHPIHKHSNKGFIIGSGMGIFNWTTVDEAAQAIPQNFNFVTPPFRDGFVTPTNYVSASWLAVRYHVVNPGAFLLHCHIQTHFSGGMAMVILDGVDAWPHVPQPYKN